MTRSSVDPRLVEPHFALVDVPARGFGLRLGQRQRGALRESSSRASTWPSRTAMPSSTFTSMTLPVIFDETVARRRAVT